MKGYFLLFMCFLLPSFHLFQFLQRRSKVIVFFVSFLLLFFLFLSPSHSSFHVDLLALYESLLIGMLLEHVNLMFFSLVLLLSCIIITIVLSVMYTHKRKKKEKKKQRRKEEICEVYHVRKT